MYADINRSDRPVVTQSTWWLLGSLYTTQSLGISFFVIALVAILRTKGMSFEMLSMVYMLGMVWPFKFLWAGWVDRWSFGRLGHYRGWMMLMQAGMIAVFGLMTLFDVVNDFWIVYGLCLLIAFLSATQDIAVDATACRKLSWQDRGMGNGIQIAGGLMGNLLGAGAVLIAYGSLGWVGCLWILMLVTSISLVQIIFYREPSDIKGTTIESGWIFLKHMKFFWQRPFGKRWLIILLVYPVGSSLAYALVTPLLVDSGWALEKIGVLMNVVGSSLGILSALGAGYLIKRMSRYKALVMAAIFQIPGIIVIAVLVYGLSDPWSATLAVGVYFICYNPAATVLATLMMDHVAPESAPGTEYTMQYSLNSFFAIGMVSVGTALLGSIGYEGVLILALVMGLGALIASFFYQDLCRSD